MTSSRQRRWTGEFAVLWIGMLLSALIIIGMALNLSPLVLAGVLGAIAAAVVSPGTGLIILAFIGPMKPPDVIPPPGFGIVLVGALLVGCVYRLPIDRPVARLPVATAPLLAFAAFVFLQQLPQMTTGYTGTTGHLVGYLFIQFATVVGAAVGAGYVLSRRSPYPYLVACLLAAGIVAALAVSSYDIPPSSSPLVGLLASSDDTSRALGSFGNPNYFGVFLATAAAVVAGLLVWFRRGVTGWLLVGLLALVGSALVLSMSRGGLAAAAVGVACLAFSLSRRAGMAVLVIGGLLLFVGYPMFVDWRLVNLSGSATGVQYFALAASDAGRLQGVLAGPLLFLTSPLFGIGFGQFSLASPQVADYAVAAHSWYSNVLGEQGLVGVILWGSFIVAIAARVRRRSGPARSVGFAVFGAYLAGCLFLEAPMSFQTSILAVVVMAAVLVGDWDRKEPVRIRRIAARRVIP